MGQILIRGLPAGTKAALPKRANSHQRSLEAEARAIIANALERGSHTLNDLLSVDEGADIDFKPQEVGLRARARNYEAPVRYTCSVCAGNPLPKPMEPEQL